MKTKKLVSLIMAGAMTLALAVPAFATATVEYTTDNTLSYDGTVNTITMDVTLPTSTSDLLILNPYGQSFTNTNITTASTDQVIFPVQEIKSKTPVPLAVSAKIKATVGSDVKLATTSVAVADAKKPVAEKQLFLFLALGSSNDFSSVTYDSKATDQQLFTAKDTTKDGMITIEAGSSSAEKSVYYKVLGDCASQPVAAWDAEKDTVNLSIAFAFVASPIDNS